MVKRKQKGFTMIEVIASMAVMSVVILAISSVITDSNALWGRLHNSVYGVMPQDIIRTQRAFNKTCRKATLRVMFLSEDKETMCLYYFSDHINPPYWPDRYAMFYLDGTDLKVEHGTLQFATINQNQELYTETLCRDVQSLQFASQGLSVQICMTVNNGSREKTFTWASVRHN